MNNKKEVAMLVPQICPQLKVAEAKLSSAQRARILALFEKLSPQSCERFLGDLFEMFSVSDRRSLVFVLEMMDEEHRQFVFGAEVRRE